MYKTVKGKLKKLPIHYKWGNIFELVGRLQYLYTQKQDVSRKSKKIKKKITCFGSPSYRPT